MDTPKARLGILEFTESVLGIHPYPWQRTTLGHIEAGHPTALTACNGAGKTSTVLVAAALWCLFNWPLASALAVVLLAAALLIFAVFVRTLGVEQAFGRVGKFQLGQLPAHQQAVAHGVCPPRGLLFDNYRMSTTEFVHAAMPPAQGLRVEVVSGGAFALSDFVPPERALPILQAYDPAKDENLCRSYGKINVLCTLNAYRELAESAGMDLVRQESITRNGSWSSSIRRTCASPIWPFSTNRTSPTLSAGSK